MLVDAISVGGSANGERNEKMFDLKCLTLD
jgi:hypothetical protein